MDLNYIEFTRHSPVVSVFVTKILSLEILRDKEYFYKTHAWGKMISKSSYAESPSNHPTQNHNQFLIYHKLYTKTCTLTHKSLPIKMIFMMQLEMHPECEEKGGKCPT